MPQIEVKDETGKVIGFWDSEKKLKFTPINPEPKREGFTVKCNNCGFTGDLTEFKVEVEIEGHHEEDAGSWTTECVTLVCKKCSQRSEGL
jgi:hypothetical protein